MDLDLNQFDTEIAHCDVEHVRNGGKTTFGAGVLSKAIAIAVNQTLPHISKKTPREELDKLDYLCAKMVEFSLYPSRRMLQGKFYCKIEEYQKAVDAFMGLYNITKDEGRDKKWPHLQQEGYNVELLVWMGHAFHQLGDHEQGRKFEEVGRKWQAKIQSSPEPN